jgi:hypothetical protein
LIRLCPRYHFTTLKIENLIINVQWLCFYVWPNLFVLFFASVIGVLNVTDEIPKVISLGRASPGFVICVCLWVSSFAMFMWCWFHTGLSDPGRIEDDLRSRGLLAEIRRGDIPRCLRSLQICPECLLPRPSRSYHCDIRGGCVLRYDHHCGVVGSCIADKNFKSFILSFVYGSAYGITNAGLTFFAASAGAIDISELLSIAAGAVSAFMGIALFVMAITFLCGAGCTETVPVSRSAHFRRFMRTFGRSWWERLLPIQRTATVLAWPGVSWDDSLCFA